jgi:hypothetical protein
VNDDEPLHPYQHAEHTMTWDDRIDWYFRLALTSTEASS